MARGILFSLLTLCCTATLYSAEQVVLIDSISGKAEVQRAGRLPWQTVTKDTRLFNNDIFRVLNRGWVRLKWPDGGTVFVHENSQILINALQDTGNNTLTTHATVFFGALFYVIKKAAPRELLPSGTKFYTPTAVVSLRGTALGVFVNKKNGLTAVKMIDGTVLVRNILKNSSLYLSAPYQTAVEMNADPSKPLPVLQPDIDSLKVWVPAYIIDDEIRSQLARSKRDQQIITGKYEDKLIVLPFVNSSDYAGKWPVESAIPLSLSNQLRHALPQLTVEVADSVKPDPLETARSYKARYVLSGIIESFELAQRAEISARADEYREYTIGKIRVRVQILDASDGKLICDEAYSGEVSGKNKTENSWQELSKYTFDLNDKQFSQSLIGQSLQQVLDQASEKIARYLQM